MLPQVVPNLKSQHSGYEIPCPGCARGCLVITLPETPVLVEFSWAPELSKNRTGFWSYTRESFWHFSLEYGGCCEQMVAASDLDLSVFCTNNHMSSHRGLV